MAAMPENAFTLEALKLIINKYGKRIKCLTTPYTKVLCNTTDIKLPYIDTDNIDDIAWNASGYDVLECKCWDPMSRKEYTSIIRIEDIISITVADNENDKIDPFRL